MGGNSGWLKSDQSNCADAKTRALRESPTGQKKPLKADRKHDPEAEFVNRWLDLVRDLERSLGQQPDALQQTLNTATKLFVMRWARKSEQTYVKGLLGQKNNQRRARINGSSVQTRHLAASLGTNSSAIDNLITKRRER